MLETSKEAEKIYVFLYGLFMAAGITDDEQPFEVVIKKEGDRG